MRMVYCMMNEHVVNLSICYNNSINGYNENRRRINMGNFIKQIQIDKVRHLQDLTIDITNDEKKHLIITGKNGSGKTTLLERMKSYLKVIPDGNLANLYSNWPKNVEMYEGLKKDILKIQDRSLEQQEKLKEYEEGIEVWSNRIKEYINGIKIIFCHNSTIAEKYAKGEFVLAYFNATRNAKIDIPTNVPKIQLQDRYGIQENIGSIFLNYLVYLKTQQSFARNENDMEEVNKIQIWFDRFEIALRNLFEDESIKLKFDYKELNFKISQKNREEYGFDALSDGYSAVLDIVINLILRMEKHCKQAYDIEGIVIIDELENHLHIGLQKKILPFLTEFFPNIQFIISTHSPFIINSIDNVVIYDLEKKQAVEDLSGIAYEGIVEGYFDINQYSENIKSKLNQYRTLVAKESKTEEEQESEYQLRKYLKQISAQLAPDIYSEYKQIEDYRKKQKNNQ